MAGRGRPRKGVSQGRGKTVKNLETKKVKKKGPSSTADVKKTKRMDEILGVEPMEFSDEEDSIGSEDLDDVGLIDVLPAPMTPRSSLKSIQQQEAICSDFNFFLQANQECAESLKKGQVGKPIMVDAITKQRDKLAFPRVLIEVLLNQPMPDLIWFENEFGSNVSVQVKYEWKPNVCGHCSGLGHSTEECRKKVAKKQQWVVKPIGQQGAERKVAEEKATVIDSDGFQPVAKAWKIKEKEPVQQLRVGNTFQALVEASTNRVEGDKQARLLKSPCCRSQSPRRVKQLPR
ncbi:hypothetical protein G4B88_005665 [Cannabis sativa]|uniref:DUF4283 domain-containing protein n=1 Tax=Cannabis sativa TaxID=3483 RepID=A0A7J6E8Q5_CANSA|nr:hypothetical protein G4B88_005665 [Cannabis sativa]